jgi:hypothetical protein
MKKAEFIKKFSKVEDTFEDEFRAEFNSPELIWKALKEQLLMQSVVVPKGTLCDVCGSDDIIEAPLMGRNCNRCNPL